MSRVDEIRKRWAGPFFHVVEFTENGYGLQHPLECRPDLIGCPFNQAMAGYDEPPMEPGRYAVHMDDNGEWFDPVDDAYSDPLVNAPADIAYLLALVDEP